MENGQRRGHTSTSASGEVAHVMLADDLHTEICDFAALQWPEEACGLLVADQLNPNRILRVVFAKNISEHPQTTFEIDPQTLINTHRSARERGELVVGCFHSHPNGKALPSPKDCERADEDGFLWLVIATAHSGALASGMYRAIHRHQDQEETQGAVARYFRKCKLVSDAS